MYIFPLHCTARAVSENLILSLAAGGARGVVRNHGYRFQNFAHLLLKQSGSLQVGVRHVPKGGKVSSLWYLCGISVSVVVYVLYCKFFYPRHYYSAVLRKLVKRLLESSSQRRLISSKRKCHSQTSSSFVPAADPGDESNSSKASEDRSLVVPGCPASSCIGDALVLEEYRLPARFSIKHRPGRRRTLSDSLDIAHLDDFICLIPEIADRPKHFRRTRNVIDWLAQIEIDTERSSSSPEGSNWPEEKEKRKSNGHPVRPLELVCANCNARGLPSDNNCESDDASSEIENADDRGMIAGLNRCRASKTSYSDFFPQGQGSQSTNEDIIPHDEVLEETLCRRLEKEIFEGADEATEREKRVFYFEEDLEDRIIGEGLLGSVQFNASHSSSIERGPLPEVPRRRPPPRLGSRDDASTHLSKVGYDWLRVRILGAHRKRLISTGSGMAAELLTSRGLTRNHYSFTSEVSAESSDYTYRESLVSKGVSVDCGEDLDRLVIPGDDLLENADFSRSTLTNIDQLHKELKNIQRDITYINSKVEILQSREDVSYFTSGYGYSLAKHLERDFSGCLDQVPTETGRRRTKSLSSVARGTEAEIARGRQIDHFKLHSGQGFARNYASDLTLNTSPFDGYRSPHSPTPVSRRNSPTGTFECDEDWEDMPPEVESLSTSADDVDSNQGDEDETTFSYEHFPNQYSDNTGDEYIYDDDDLLTSLHR